MPVEALGHSAAIVLVGNFNPAIFTPSWFALNGLITAEDAELSEIRVVHPQIAEFEIKNYNIHVDLNRFQIVTTEEPFVIIADVVNQLFGGLLSHTPISQCAINYSCHFAVSTAAKRVALGRAMAPLGPWGEWGGDLEKTGDPSVIGGLRSIAMLDPKPEGREKGYRQVQLEPSVRLDIVNNLVGVYMHVNDHFESATKTGTSATPSCVEWVIKYFDESIYQSKKIIGGVYDFAETL